MMPPKRVSLSNELHLAIDALQGVHALTRQWSDSFGSDPQLPDHVAATVSMIVERLRLLDRVVRGTVDPRLVWSPQNDKDSIPGDPREDDVVFSEWIAREPAAARKKPPRSAKRRRPIVSRPRGPQTIDASGTERAR